MPAHDDRPPRPRRKGKGGFGPYHKADGHDRARDGGESRRGRPDEAGAGAESGTERPRSRYRVVGKRGAKPEPKRSRARSGGTKPSRPRRRRQVSDDVRDEIMRLGGSKGPRYYEQLAKAADAFARDRERDALRMIRPLQNALPEAPSVRELSGLIHYRLGHYPAASKELEAYVRLTGAVDQHPVLMDCYRAQRRWRNVEECWRELSTASPSAELVTEGRIVAAGALADRGRLDDALALLERRDKPVSKPREHHLRLWYALADLEERAGNLPRARVLFERIRRNDAGFADVAERLAALG
jgi:tetratricopeptide (TPR) repeat protein